MRTIWRWITQTRDLDVYLTVVVALVVSVLSYTSVVPADRLPALVLAVLAVMAFTSLTSRRMLSAIAPASQVALRDDFDPTLIETRNRSRSTLLAGVSLSRTIETSYGAFEQLLATGATIKILLIDPDADHAALDTRGQLARPDTADLRREVRASLAVLTRLYAGAGPGMLEVRLTRTALKFGVNHVDIGTRDEAMHVQFYSYRLAGESRPILVVRPRDGHWFTCFAEQVGALWEDAQPADLGTRAARGPTV